MMWKNIYAKTLLAFFVCLTPVSLAGCNQTEIKQGENSAIESSRNQHDSLIEIINRTYDLEISVISDLMPTIQKIKFNKNKNIFEFPENLDNSLKNANLKIESLQQLSQKYANELQIIDIKQDIRQYATENLEKINTSIDNLKNITEPLNNKGFNDKNKIIQLQQYLNKNSDNNIQEKFSGSLDSTTKAQIVNYLQRETNLLKLHVNCLIIIDKNFNTQTESSNNKNNFIGWIVAVLIIFGLPVLGIFLTRKSSSSRQISSFGHKKTVETRASAKDKKNDIDEEELYQRLYNHLHQGYSEDLNLLKSKIQEIEKHLNKNISQPQQSTILSQNDDRETTEHTPSSPNYTAPNLLAAYNNDPGSLYSKATEVNVTEESIDERRLGSGQKAILEAKKAGSYWILKEGRTDYLVPKKHFTFNQHQYKTAQALFQCQGYQPSFRQKFRVVKPARVTFISGDKWQLEEMGSLEFH